MSFDERNARWEGHHRTFVQMHSRGSAPRVWGIRVDGNQITTTWGQLNGAMQAAVESMQGVNQGKKNEKTPEQYALERSRETCRKKNWEGYREVGVMGGGVPVTTTEGNPLFLDPIVPTEIDLDKLPLSLCFYKPDTKLGLGLRKKAEAGKVWYARKANGMMFVIAKGTGPAKLYSRRMLRHQDDEVGQDDKTWDRRFSYIQGAADFIMPPNSVLLGELIIRHLDTEEEDFKAIQSLTKCLTEEAFPRLVALQDERKAPAFYCWDIAFWNGQNLVKEAPVKERYALIHEVIEGCHLLPVQYYDHRWFSTPEHATAVAISKKWEGFVVVDPEGVYGDKGYNFKGKPDRPGASCAKLKPVFEDDFIAEWNPEVGVGERSTKESRGGGIKSVSLSQLNSKGEKVFICNVASGLSKEQLADWADPSKFPMVWKVEYTERFYQSEEDETNALIFPRFSEVRTDKSADECINTRL